jgi:tetratricopeptide (TPR) repeat protein
LCVGFAGEIAGQPTEADVFVAEGILALEDKQYAQALAAFRQALEREVDHIEALYYAGVALMAQDKPGEALPFLERARQKSPPETPTLETPMPPEAPPPTRSAPATRWSTTSTDGPLSADAGGG